MKTCVELSKVIVSDAQSLETFFFFCDTHSNTCLSFFLRWHTSSNPCSHWHATRGPHTRICKSCEWSFCFLCSLGPATVLSSVSDWVYVFLSRSSTDRGNTRSVSRVHLVPLRSCWSIRTRPVPLLLFCPSLHQMMSFKTSQRRHLPLSCPLLPPRSTQISAFSMWLVLFMYWSVYCKRVHSQDTFLYWNSKEDEKDIDPKTAIYFSFLYWYDSCVCSSVH